MIKQINLKNLIKFTIPSVLTMVFLSVYTLIDGVFVSNFIDENALSAINLVYPPISIIIAIGLMLATGGNAICAKLLGEGNTEKARANFTLFTISGLIIGVISSFIMLMFIEPILGFLGVNSETYQYAYDYITLISLFFSSYILQTIFQNALIATGKPNISLLFMVLGGLTHITLAYTLLSFTDLGMRASALATGIGASIAPILGIIYFLKPRKDSLLYFVKPKFDIKVLLHACGNGSSEMVTNIATAITTLLFNLTMLELLGNDGVAAISVVIYSQFLLGAVFMGYAMGIAPVISFYFGEKNKDNLKALFNLNTKIIGTLSIVSFILAIVLAEPIAAVFTEHGSNIYNLTVHGLKLFSSSFLFAGLNIFASGMFTAYSNGLVSATISFSRTFILILGCILLLPQFIGVDGVWLAIPIAEFITIFMSITFFIIYRKKYMYSNSQAKSELLIKASNLETDK